MQQTNQKKQKSVKCNATNVKQATAVHEVVRDSLNGDSLNRDSLNTHRTMPPTSMTAAARGRRLRLEEKEEEEEEEEEAFAR